MEKSRRLALLVLALGTSGACAPEGAVDAVELGGVETFEEYVASLPRTDDGGYVVEHDIPVYEREALYDYYARTLTPHALTIEQGTTNIDSKYSVTRAEKLTYCVSDAFGADKALVRDTLAQAVTDWSEATKMSAADTPTVKFVYMATEDANCTNTNINVEFNVIPATSTLWDALAFMPTYERARRQLQITPNAMVPFNRRTFLGVLRHELGHVLGFRHELVRQPGNVCDDALNDPTFRGVTPYDIPSVMHYRLVNATDCVNNALSDYTLSPYDKAGVRCIYTTQARTVGAVDKAADACVATPTVGATAGLSFAVDADGILYKLERVTDTAGTSTTRVHKFFSATPDMTPPGWTRIWQAVGDTTSSEIKAGGRQLYRVQGAKFFRWNGTAWAQLTGAPGKSVVAYGSGDLFRLNDSGTIDRFVAGTTSPVTILSTAAAGRRLFAGPRGVYRIDADGSAFEWTTAGWSASAIGTGLAAIATDRSGIVYGLLNDVAGTIMQRTAVTGEWTTVGKGASKLWGGLENIYDSPKNDPATPALDESTIVRRRVGTSTTWKQFATKAKSFMRGSDRKLKVGTDNKVHAYMDP